MNTISLAIIIDTAINWVTGPVCIGTKLSLVPRPHPQGGKGSGDIEAF